MYYQPEEVFELALRVYREEGIDPRDLTRADAVKLMQTLDYDERMFLEVIRAYLRGNPKDYSLRDIVYDKKLRNRLIQEARQKIARVHDIRRLHSKIKQQFDQAWAEFDAIAVTHCTEALGRVPSGMDDVLAFMSHCAQEDRSACWWCRYGYHLRRVLDGVYECYCPGPHAEYNADGSGLRWTGKDEFAAHVLFIERQAVARWRSWSMP